MMLSAIGRTRRRIIGLLIAAICCGPVSAQIGLWTSAAELVDKPMSGLPWESVKAAADAADPGMAFVSDQNNNNNAQILAAAIVYARSGDTTYQTKVTAACEKLVSAGYPALAPGISEEDNRTLAWARETGAYALAADLVGYRTPEFETWLRRMAEEYIAYDERTLLHMFHVRPNNWGTHAFGSLCAIYAYLQDTTSLGELRDYWIQAVVGPKPDELEYGDDLSWHADPSNLRLINPKGAVKQGLNIDGITPDDMRRNGSFSNPPPTSSTTYHWGALQGQVSGGRILERMGMPIWDVADSALYRAGYALQVRWENSYGGWKAEGDDLWLLPFFDSVYGTHWSEGQPERVWKHGKNAGWPYVVWDGTISSSEEQGSFNPGIYELLQNYPNPFNPVTRISLSIAETSPVHLAVYDLVGREVSTLLDGVEEAGEHILVWEAVNREGTQLPSGIYLCRLLAGYYQKTLKMTVLR
ncbi:MAG: T9SS type A sorting domain-containing protein [Fidelibacterota bacterium]|nr:MAG: T9SS type A sorting domain-containing protein [Candidatus Neomarinimicrobiota bacterium]